MASTIVTSRPRARDVAATSAPMNPAPIDHHVLGAAGQLGPERVRVVQAAQDVHPEQSVGGRQTAGHAAGGDDDPVRRDLLTRGEDDPATGDVEPLRRDTQVPPRVELVDVRLLGERQVVGPHRPEQVLLGQRRTVVGQVRLCADDDQVVVVALGPELLCGPQPGQRGSDDGDRPAGHATPCRVRASTRSSASSAGAGCRSARPGRSVHVHDAVLDQHRIGTDRSLGRGAGRLAGPQVERGRVQRALDHAVLEPSLRERRVLVGAGVVDREQLAVGVEHGHRDVRHDAGRLSRGEISQGAHLNHAGSSVAYCAPCLAM